MNGLLHLTRDPSAWQCQCGAGVLLFRRLLERAWSNNRVKMGSLLNSPGPDTHSENRTELSPPTNSRRLLLSGASGPFNTHRPTSRAAV